MVVLRFGVCCQVFWRYYCTKALDFKTYKLSFLAFSQLLALSNCEFIKYSNLVIVSACTQMHVSSANKRALVKDAVF